MYKANNKILVVTTTVFVGITAFLLFTNKNDTLELLPKVRDEVTASDTKEFIGTGETESPAPSLDNESRPTNPITDQIEPSETTEVIVIGFYVNGQGDIYKTEQNKLLVDFMIDLETKNLLSFSTKDFSGIGKFVTEINGVKERPREGYYWTLYINGNESNVGVSQYKLNNDDQIGWVLESRL